MYKRRPLLRRAFSLGVRIARGLPATPFFLMSLPFTLFLILLFPFVKIKFIRLCSNRIGHYAMNTELLLCYLDDIKLNEKRTKYFFYLLNSPICNTQLHAMWKRVIPILSSRKIIFHSSNTLQFIFRDCYKNNELKNFEVASGNRDIRGYFKKYRPHLFFEKIELENGSDLLLKLGIPVGSKYVCLYARDSAYLNKQFPEKDWSYHDYRDCDIQNFLEAALFLANKGYYVVRMGKVVAKPFDMPHPKIIDYACSQLRSDFADIYLTAHCEFFISTSAGLDGVAQIFRKPVLCVNVAPFKHQLQYWYPCELFITKKIFDNAKDCFVKLSDIESKIENVSSIQEKFYSCGWSVVENNQKEILEAVCEMELHISKKSSETISNPFWSLLRNTIPLSVVPDRDLLRSCPEKCYVRMGEKFWNDNQCLFTE